MHKIVLKLFGFLRSCTQFVKIILVFCMLMFLLYWTEHLAGMSWGWLGFISPLFDLFVDLGGKISSGSINLFEAVFEFKYFIALLLFGVLYALDHLIFISLIKTEDLYDDGHRLVKKINEDRFNTNLQNQQVSEQKKLKRFQVYVSTSVKKKFSHKEFKVDLEEQNKIMNKFLIKQTNSYPQVFEGGFLYTFDNFENIDSVLETFFKLINSEAPLDYIICVQIIGYDTHKETEQLKALINLKFINKISTMADTIYRYGFNLNKNYKTAQLGVFKKGEETFETHEFY